MTEIAVSTQTSHNGEMMKAHLPFSWVIKDQIEALVHQTKNTDSSAGEFLCSRALKGLHIMLGYDEPIIGRNPFQSQANIYQFIPILQNSSILPGNYAIHSTFQGQKLQFIPLIDRFVGP